METLTFNFESLLNLVEKEGKYFVILCVLIRLRDPRKQRKIKTELKRIFIFILNFY